MQINCPTTKTWHATLDGSGRVVVPAELRQRLDLKPGEPVVWLSNADEVGLVSHDQLVRLIQAEFQGLVPPGSRLATEELSRQRREEAVREDAEEDGGRV